jgi:hypothetical protein
MVLGYEIWSMLEPNALFDITEHLTEKLYLIQSYGSQVHAIDYARYSSCLAGLRAFQAAFRPSRAGAAEAFIALPNQEYCKLIGGLCDAGEQWTTNQVPGSAPVLVAKRTDSPPTQVEKLTPLPRASQ